MSGESNYDKLRALGIPLKKMTGQTKTICPKCSHTRTHKNDPCLSVNIDEGKYTCHHNCGFQGNVSYNPNHKPKKVYVKPVWSNATQLSDGHVAYWAGRGISQQTLIQVKISEGIMWMPQTNREESTMQWPYIRNGEVVDVKYRGSMQVERINPTTLLREIVYEKIFRLIKDAERIFWNLDSIKDSDECLITEGEPDGMSFIEAGYLPVVSVPNGATKANNNLQYLDNCIEYFENKKKIYIGVDNDEAGRALQAELIRRLGAERCWIVNYVDCKDANEYLIKHGKLALPLLLNWAKPAEIDGIMEANDARADVFDLFENGLPEGEKIGIKEIDEHISFLPGQFTVVTGIPSHGKSQMLDFILERLAVVKGWKVAYFTPEAMPLKLFLAKLIQKITGKTFEKKFGPSNRVTMDEIAMAMDFIQDHFFFISIKQKLEPKEGVPNQFVMPNYSLDNILSLGKKMVVRYGINALVIDPWNKLTHLKQGGLNDTEYILDKLNEIIFFGETNRVHMFLVAHPTKIKKDKQGKYEIPTLYDISGSAHFYNTAYNGFTIYRDFEKHTSTMYVQKIKLSWLGKVGAIALRYDWISGRYNVDGCIPDKGNHLLAPPLNQGYNEPSSVMQADGSSGNAPVITAESNQINEDLPF